jgi:aminoglycoside phosphotransferase (APT) family kinase protein
VNPSEAVSSEARLAEVERLLEREQEEHPPLRTPDDVPGTADAMTPGWLTTVLCADHPGAAVEDVSVDHDGDWRHDGVGAGRRVTVTYNGAGQEAGLPEHLWSKYSPTLLSRQLVGVNGSSGGEVAFYKELAPTASFETPLCYYAGFEERSCRTLMLFEDLTSTKKPAFPTAVGMTINRELADSMVDVIAGLHAASWGDRGQTEYQFRDAKTFQEDFNDTFGFEAVSLKGFENARDYIPDEIYARKDEWHDAFMRSLELNVQAEPTLLHQDMHIGNWYVLSGESMGLNDYQALARGQWALDVAYALALNLTVENRRTWEKDLLARYLGNLQDAGVAAPDFDDAWLAYRQQMFHALAFWVSTTGWGEDRTQPENVCNAFIERAARAIVDLDSWRALDEKQRSRSSAS